ncbi:hypothetical protein B0I72DRAFT_163561 [Yarrowia lipolytica]|uniref:Uncharacterized protein n=1 Tax=Yarrowia lipolytica TaxID=4952 RepID=A0A371BZI1_YARLL|nr:hypothetical protein B0I71DRAFT_104255 [Yarrowia lipolytica]RDW29463.1 hypothetical protein B0I72DRAFT_163561 [Yarrowia lipolytica]
MKFSALVSTSLLALASTAPVDSNIPYHYEVNSTSATLDGQPFLQDASVIVEQGGPFAITLNPENWALFTDTLYNHTGLTPKSPKGLLVIECARAEDAKFEANIHGQVFHFTGKEIVKPDPDHLGFCSLNVWKKIIDANYFGQQFIDNVLHGKTLPGKWLGPGPKPSNWRD